MKKENEAIKDRKIRDIRNFPEHERKYYYKLVRVGKFWCNNYIEHGSNADKIKTYQLKNTLMKVNHT